MQVGSGCVTSPKGPRGVTRCPTCTVQHANLRGANVRGAKARPAPVLVARLGQVSHLASKPDGLARSADGREAHAANTHPPTHTHTAQGLNQHHNRVQEVHGCTHAIVACCGLCHGGGALKSPSHLQANRGQTTPMPSKDARVSRNQESPTAASMGPERCWLLHAHDEGPPNHTECTSAAAAAEEANGSCSRARTHNKNQASCTTPYTQRLPPCAA
jgi:hypothetical protein